MYNQILSRFFFLFNNFYFPRTEILNLFFVSFFKKFNLFLWTKFFNDRFWFEKKKLNVLRDQFLEWVASFDRPNLRKLILWRCAHCLLYEHCFHSVVWRQPQYSNDYGDDDNNSNIMTIFTHFTIESWKGAHARVGL